MRSTVLRIQLRARSARAEHSAVRLTNSGLRSVQVWGGAATEVSRAVVASASASVCVLGGGVRESTTPTSLSNGT